VATVLVQLAAGKPLNPGEWRYYSPILSSQIKRLDHREADTILAGFCQTPVRSLQGVGPTCTTRREGSAFSDIVDRAFHPKGIIFGHFLGPESDDAAVGGSSAEAHPDRWGGTLLLNRRGGVWVPLWYRSALIIDSCEKVALPNHREVLLCEDEDSGMGHSMHYLYTVDLGSPSDLQRSLLAKADSFKDDCVSQKQLMDGFHWEPDRRGLFVEVATTEWERVSTEMYCANYPKQRPTSARLAFAVTADGLRKMGAERAAKR
jgi:hypothetical protein